MRRTFLLFLAIVGIATLVPVPLRPSLTGNEGPLVLPSPNLEGKSDRADAGMAALAGYVIVEAENAPVTRGVAAAVHAAMQYPLPPPPEPPAPTSVLLNDAQIAALKSRLELTSEQETHWPPVEQALKAFVQKQYELHRKRSGAAAESAADELAALTGAAAPLLASLDERQKRQVRLLAGMLGLTDAIEGL